MAVFERLFRISENNSTISREVLGGVSTFLTMSYIIFVQPIILAESGMDPGAVMAATCVSSAVACFLMAFLANYPIALAPAMGHNVFFAYTVCLTMGIPWQTALGATFICGVLFVIMGAFGIRRMIMDVIPQSLKMAISVGIGLMIALLGFQWAGIVVEHPATLITIGTLTSPFVYVSGIGFVVAIIMVALNMRGAVLMGILVSAGAALLFGLTSYEGLLAAPPSLAPTFMHMDPIAAIKEGLFTIIFVFLILDIFDTVGTLVGVAELGGFMKDGQLPRARQALLSDAGGTIIGAVLGTSTITSYVESSSGISDGARTGLANIVTGILFLLALFFSPLMEMLGKGIVLENGSVLYPVIAPALILVGFMMMRAVKMIPWEDPLESIPAFLCITLIAFSFSITEGIAFGFISYTLLMAVAGRWRELNPVLIGLSALFVFRYFFIEF